MRRRTFLQICTGVAITTTAAFGGRWITRFGDDLEICGRALFPGVPLHLLVAPGTPKTASLRLTITHDGRDLIVASPKITPGERLTLPTPYPYDDLVPGVYDVRVELIDPAGTPTERHDVGGYQLIASRFSA